LKVNLLRALESTTINWSLNLFAPGDLDKTNISIANDNNDCLMRPIHLNANLCLIDLSYLVGVTGYGA
jgi:hypothetical protein